MYSASGATIIYTVTINDNKIELKLCVTKQHELTEKVIVIAIESSIRMISRAGSEPSVYNWNHTRVCCQCLNSKFHLETYLNQLVKISKPRHLFTAPMQGSVRSISQMYTRFPPSKVVRNHSRRCSSYMM